MTPEPSEKDLEKAEQTILSLLDLRQIDSLDGRQIILDLIADQREEDARIVENGCGECGAGMFQCDLCLNAKRIAATIRNGGK